MCPNCDGQIPTVHYMAHIEQCYAAKHAQYEQRNDVKAKANIKKDKISMEMDDLLFSTPYKSECYPLNPLESKIDEQSESDIETVSCLCPPDINDRKKVIAQLIKTKKKYEFDHCTFSLQHCDDAKKKKPQQAKELEMWHKVYTRLIDQNDDDLSSSPSLIGYEENMQNILRMNANQRRRRRQSMHRMQNMEDSEDEEDEEEEDDDEDEDEDDDDDIP